MNAGNGSRLADALAASCEHSKALEKRLARCVAALDELIAERANDFHHDTEGFNMARDAMTFARTPTD